MRFYLLSLERLYAWVDIACETSVSPRSSRNVPIGEERGEMDVFTG